MEIVIILLICASAVIVTSLIFRHLVTTNKIDESKLSKIFYKDKESSIEYLKKTQEKGILMYILKYIIMSTSILVIIGIYVLLKKINLSDYVQQNQMFFIVFFFITVLNSVIGWGMDKHRYRKLVEKRNVENDSLNNDDKK